MNEQDVIIRVRDLSVGYGKTIILENVSFDIRRREIFVILGGSGCGKSTLMKHLIGLYPPVIGSITIDGIDLVKAEGEKRNRIFNSIGVMYQSGALFGSLSLIDNVLLPLEEFTQLPEGARHAVAQQKLRLVGLAGFEDYMPAELSGGMQKRAAIARALALEPHVLFLDEPSAGLDPVTSSSLDILIKELSSSLDMTFIVVTHELSSIYTIAERVIMLDKEEKGIIAEGRPEELKQSKNKKVYAFFNRMAEV